MRTIEKVKNKILDNNNFLITTHTRAEGDAIGSELAFYYLLRRLKKKATILNPDSVPKNLEFLPALRQIKVLKEIPDKRAFDVFVVLDAPDPERIGDMKSLLKEAKFVINIDHHVSNTKFGNLNWIEKNASSVGEMIYHLYKNFALALDYKISFLIYTAILTDTGSFRYINTKPQTHQIVSELLKRGVKPDKVYNQIFENNSLEKIRLISACLKTIKKKGKVAWLEITKDILNTCHAEQEDLEGIIDYVRSVRDVKVAIVFQELEDDSIKVSLRSKDDKLDVNEIAEFFGGGGHRTASGCKIKGNLRNVKIKVLKEIEKSLKRSM